MNSASISVCMFSNLYPPVVSGSSIQLASLSCELARRGCQAVVITAKHNGESKEYEELDGVHVYRLSALRLPKMPISLNFPWLSFTFTPANQRRIQDILNRHQPDVIHLHNHMFDLAFSASLAAKRTRKPLVTTIHTVIKHPKRFYNWFLYPADRLFLKHFVINRTDILICPDITIQGYVYDAFGKTNIALVPYGISLPPKPDKEIVDQVRRKYHLTGDPIILSLGHVHEIRNRKDLIEAMPMVLERFPGAVLLIVGAIGTDTAESLACKLGVRKSVIFTGAVPHSEVPAYLEIADLEAHWFQQDNPQCKTLGIAALEAMGAGKVVIGTADENVYGEGVLRNKDNVILVEPGNPGQLAQTIVDLLSDRERRRAIGERARQTIQEHFSWDSVCSRTLDVYGEVLRKRTFQ